MTSKKTDIWMPLYIADYLSSTNRLTTEQHGAYLLLIMDYWKNGRLPDDDSVLSSVTRLSIDRWIVLRGVLEGFFKVSHGEWIHERIEKELENSGEMKLSKIKKSIAGNYVRHGSIDPRVESDSLLKSWFYDEFLKNLSNNKPSNDKNNSSPKESLKESPKAPSSPSPSHLSKDNINTKAIALPPEGVDVVVWDDFQKLRKTKKAPLTKTAIDRIEREGNKAGLNLNDTLVICCSRGWAGFEASWLDKKGDAQESFRERDQRLASERYQQAAGLSPKIIDIIPMELLA